MELQKIYGYVIPVSNEEELELLQCVLTRKRHVTALLLSEHLSATLCNMYEEERDLLDTLLSKINGCWKTPITDKTVLSYNDAGRSDKELIDFI